MSVALKKLREGRADVVEQGLADFASLRLVRCSTNAEAQLGIAERYDLSAYDAAYLQLSVEMNAPLATFDRELAQVARRVLDSQ